MAPSWKEVETDEEIENLRVTLPPVLGVSPERYIPVFYSVLIAVVLFLVFVLPGIRRYGTVLTVVSAPVGASVTVDDVRYGTTPLEIFLPAGEREVTLSFPGLEETTRTVELGGRRIGSLLMPRRQRLEVTFDRGLSPDGIEHLITEYHEWALSGEPGPQFQHPPLARTLGRAIWATSDPTRGSAKVSEGLPDSDDRAGTTDSVPDTGVSSISSIVASLVSGAAAPQLPDLTGGLLRSGIPGAVQSHQQTEQLVHLFVHYDNKYPGFTSVVERWIEAELPFDRSILEEWRDGRMETLSTELLAASLELDERAIPRIEKISIADTSFHRVPRGTYILGYPARDEEETSIPIDMNEPFYLMEHEVTVREFARFVEANPRWAPDRRDELVEAELVDDRYLLDWPADWKGILDGGSPADLQRLGSMPVRYVSWYAAVAYAEWFASNAAGVSVPGIDNDIRVSLPDMVGWEYAAFLDALGPATRVLENDSPRPARDGTGGALGLLHMRGNLWEWSSDWYTENAPVVPAPFASQRAVMGGSYANPLLPLGTVGSQPPEWCTPFLGFRLAIYGESDAASESD
ncbi:MAG: SUMF1/EgtB/PvdO family nonheme iron enzyme [Alkalispirochaeta sp.]